MTGPLAGAPAVRKLRLHRKGRIELAPTLSFTLLDEYQRTMLTGIRANYNITDWLAVGVWGAFGAVHVTTALSDNIQSNNDKKYATPTSNNTSQVNLVDRRLTGLNVGKDFSAQLGTIQWIAAPQITAVPFRGKLSLFEKVFVDTDAYLFAGAGFVGLRERADCGGSASAADCSKKNNDANGTYADKDTTNRVAIAPTFGLGLNFYIGQWMSLGLDYRALPFAWNTGGFDSRGGGPDQKFPDNKVDDKDRTFKFNQLATISFGFYFPRILNTSE
ncbi:MAG: hypothetical protein U0165_07605 [Polyangiaceae bacterium]